MEKNQNHIEDIFREAFQHHEMDVNPIVWAGVQSTISGATGAAGTAATGAGMMKAAAVVGLSSIIAVGTINEVKLQSSSQAGEDAIVIENLESAESTAEEALQLPADTWTEAPNEQPQTNQIESSIDQPEDVSEEVVEPVEASVALTADAEPKPHIESETGESEQNRTEPKGIADNQNSKKQPSPASQEPEENNTETEEQTSNEKSYAGNMASADEHEEEKEETPVCSIQLAHDAKGYISPDGDGTNDCFKVPDANQAKQFQIRIYTREGLEVFSSDDPYFNWCGTDNRGNLLPNKTLCFYEIFAVDENDIRYTKRNARGSIHVFH